MQGLKTAGWMSDKNLQGRKALVTGGNSGIGEAIARRLAAAGAHVVINYRSYPQAAQKIVEEINKEGGQALAIEADISSEQEITRMFIEADKQVGAMDILVNNAGIENNSAFLELSAEDWDKVLNVDLRAVFLCSQQAARRMQTGGVIINISSVHELIPWAGYAHYCAAKGGLEMLMKTMALELAQNKIRVNNIAPGAIITPINNAWLDDPKKRDEVLAKIPWGRIGRADEVAAAAWFLASDDAEYITGTTLFIDGGMSLYANFLA